MSYYYKVVRREFDGLVSCNAPLSYTLEYKQNIWTKPYLGTEGIFVFKDFYAAENFVNENVGNLEIWKCLVKNPRKLESRTRLSEYSILNFWRRYREYRDKHKSVKHVGLLSTPQGTYIASEVMLVEKAI